METALLILGDVMYDREQQMSDEALTRTRTAIAWAKHHPETTLYLSASRPTHWPDTLPTHAAATKQAVAAEYEDIKTITNTTHFNTKAEVQAFLDEVGAGIEEIGFVSDRYHLPRVFCYVWEYKGWKTARGARYVATARKHSIRVWYGELVKLLVILLPIGLQQRLEEWYARRTYTW